MNKEEGIKIYNIVQEITELQKMVAKYKEENKYLQEENKQLKEQLEEKTYLYNRLSIQSKYVIKDLRERIDKAIEYMNNEEFILLMMSSYNENENYFKAKNNVLEILKGDSNE